METVFRFSNVSVLPFWLLMIFLPRWSFTKRMMGSMWSVILLSFAYALLMLPGIPSAFGSLMNPQLGDIASLLGRPEGATVAWLHFLAFDLFVGRWAYLDSLKKGIPPWYVSPTLFFILMFGPIGLLLYLGLARNYLTVGSELSDGEV